MQCGWRNEPTALRCGGCGSPLSAAAVSQPAPFVGGYDATRYASEGPTQLASAPAPAPGRPQAPAYAQGAPVWPGAVGQPQASARKRRGPWRGLLVLLLVLAILAGGAAGTWAMVLRPAIHHILDSRLRTALDNLVAEVPAQPNVTLPPGLHDVSTSIPAAAFNEQLAREAAATGNVRDPQVHFQNGDVIISFVAFGRTTEVTTRLVAQGGRVYAEQTTVNCPLCFVETGSELQDTFNEALGRLPAAYDVTAITANADMLSLTLHFP
jgi:hypothetical protein